MAVHVGVTVPRVLCTNGTCIYIGLYMYKQRCPELGHAMFTSYVCYTSSQDHIKELLYLLSDECCSTIQVYYITLDYATNRS